MKKSLSTFLILILCSNNIFASSVSQKKPYPYAQGVALAKNFLYLNARELSAGAGLNTFWSDTFKDNSQINSGSSSGYTYRGSTNFDVIVNSTPTLFGNNMTSNVLPSPLVASASSSATAWKAFDGVEGASEYWQSSTAGTEWLSLDCGVAKTFTQYKVLGNTAASNSPAAWTIQGSNTGAFGGEEVTLDTRSGQSTGGSKQTYTMSSTGSYRYYRMRMTAISSSTSYCVQSLEYYEAGSSSAVVRSVATTFASSVSDVLVFAEVTLNSGSITLIRVSANGGSTWKTLTTTDLEKVISLGHSGTSLILEITFTGNAELEFWGVAA